MLYQWQCLCSYTPRRLSYTSTLPPKVKTQLQTMVQLKVISPVVELTEWRSGKPQMFLALKVLVLAFEPDLLAFIASKTNAAGILMTEVYVCEN